MQNQISKCNKFLSQAFNPNKCQNCFKNKDLHSSDALLEYTKSSRRAIKIGYLFIAPSDIDITKTKRWQWRFFVLYDDGELTYSLDDNPLTLPQGKIYTDKCQDVLDATGLTGYPNSLQLAFCDHTNVFIAGSGLEDIVKWKETLMSLIERLKKPKGFGQRYVNKPQQPQDKPRDTKPESGTTNTTIDTSADDKQEKPDDQAPSRHSHEIDLIDADMDDDVDEDFEEDYGELEVEDDIIDIDDDDEEDEDDDNHLYNTSENRHKSISATGKKAAYDKRRHSYKEDDKLRKQRLKENLNQLLIEYKHEEEAQLRKSTQYLNTLSATASVPIASSATTAAYQKRASLDIPTTIAAAATTKSTYRTFNSLSSTILKQNTGANRTTVVAPSLVATATVTNHSISTIDLTKQNYINSAFKPINKATSSIVTAAASSTSTTTTTTGATCGSSASTILCSGDKTQIIKDTNDNSSSSTYSSSSSSSWSSTSSTSNSPPKLRIFNSSSSALNTTSSGISNNVTTRKPQQLTVSPTHTKELGQSCQNINKTDSLLLTSPSYASTSSSSSQSNKSLTIMLRNNSQTDSDGTPMEHSQPHHDLNDSIQSIQVNDDVFENNACNFEFIRNGYLWKLRDNKKNWDKYWFSLNQSSLSYFIDKNNEHEQKSNNSSSLTAIGKIDLYKCTQVKELLLDYEQFSLQLISHTNNVNIVLRTSSFDLRSTWAHALKQAIEHHGITCSKCKPKLIVNPMQLNSASGNSVATNSTITSSAKDNGVNVKSSKSNQAQGSTSTTTSPLKQDTVNSTTSTTRYSIQRIPQTKTDSIAALSNESKTNSNSISSINFNNSSSSSNLNKQYGRYKNNDNRNSAEINYENLIEKLNTLKDTHDLTVAQMISLTEQLEKQKDTIQVKDREIDRLKSQMSSSTTTVEPPSSPQQQQQQQSEGWNKEVRNLDARISDVLGKIKERELFLNTYDDWERRCKEYEKKYETASVDLDRTKGELTVTGLKLNDLKSENDELKLKIKQVQQQQQQVSNDRQPQLVRKISIHDFDDDLGKVLMSKEEVITQLEKTIQDKDATIHDLQTALNEEAQQTAKAQEQMHQLKMQIEQLNGSLSMSRQAESDLKEENKQIDEKYQESKNEIDYLQEEIKTLEFKFAHSQKEIQDYKNLLDNFDMKLLTSRSAHDLTQKLEAELNETKNENNELNAHIFALDEFMRDKEAQCDQLEEINRKLLEELNKFKLNTEFLGKFSSLLSSANSNVKDFYLFLINFGFYFKKLYKNGTELTKLCELNLNDEKILTFFNKIHQTAGNDETAATRGNNKTILKSFKLNLNSLNKFYTNDILTINKQLITYMSEQLIHKAIINGQLKFVCDTLRKKMNLQSNVLNCGTNGSSSSLIKIKRASFVDSQNGGNDLDLDCINRDENICKIASELLLYDEDSLRKLSGQLLNEAEHLNQLNCVISAIKKLRHKQFLTIIKEFEQYGINTEMSNDGGLDDDDDDDDDDLIDLIDIDDNFEDMEQNQSGTSEQNDNFEDYVNQIMNSVNDIYTEHKVDVCEQLNEMHKLMSITSDDDLFAHLQNENDRLKQDLRALRTTITNDTKCAIKINLQTDSNKSIGNVIKTNLFKTSLLSQDDTMC